MISLQRFLECYFWNSMLLFANDLSPTEEGNLIIKKAEGAFAISSRLTVNQYLFQMYLAWLANWLVI